MLKLKVYLSVFLLTTAFLAVVILRFDSAERQQSVAFIEAQSQVVLAGLSQALKTEFKKWAYSQSFSNQTLQGFKAKAYFIAHLDGEKKYVYDRSDVFIGDEYQNYLQKYFEPRFVKLQKEKRPSEEAHFYFEPLILKPKDEEKPTLKMMSLIFQSGPQVFGVLLDSQVFQTHLDLFKSSDGQMTVVNEDKMILAQSEENYFGTKATGIEDVSSQKEFLLSGSIPQTNLKVVFKASYDKIFAHQKMSWLQFVLIGAGFLFLCLGVLSFVLSSKEDNEDKLSKQNALLNLEVDRLKKDATKVKIAEPMATAQIPIAVQEKIDQAKNTLSSLAHEMNPHLLAVAGLVSRAEKSTPQHELLKMFQGVTLEVQKARAIITKIFEYTGVSMAEKEQASLELPIHEALRNLKSLLEKNEVQIVKNIQTKTPIKMVVKHLVRVLSELIENSIEAMERMPNKKITIAVMEDEREIKLSLKDNGTGIDVDKIDKIFEPFFTTRGFKNKKGLGLSAVMGIAKEHNAECTVQSTPGNGCEVVMTFKKDVIEVSKETRMDPDLDLAVSNIKPVFRQDDHEEMQALAIQTPAELPNPPPSAIQRAMTEKDNLHDEIVNMALQKANAEKKQAFKPSLGPDSQIPAPVKVQAMEPDLEDLLSFPDAKSSKDLMAATNHNVGRPKFKMKRTESVLSEFAPPTIPQRSLNTGASAKEGN